MHLLILSSHFNHRRVTDRVHSAITANVRVTLLYIARSAEEAHLPLFGNSEMVRCHCLAIVPEGSVYSRMLSLVFAAFKAKSLSRKLPNIDGVLVNNFTTLLLSPAISHARRVPKIYDVADIQRLQYGSGFIPRCIRWLETKMVSKFDAIAVTSPWFATEYFRGRIPISKTHLLENRVRKQILPPPQIISNDIPSAPTIVWNGVLRCDTSMRTLATLASTFPDIRVVLRGRIGRIDSETVEAARRVSSLHFGEPYDDANLLDVMSEATYVWGIDLDDGLNSKWLLPNRLYQSVYCCKPIIALSDTATGDVVKYFGIGIVLDALDASIIHRALQDTKLSGRYAQLVENMRSLSNSSVRGSEWARFITTIMRRKPAPFEIDPQSTNAQQCFRVTLN